MPEFLPPLTLRFGLAAALSLTALASVACAPLPTPAPLTASQKGELKLTVPAELRRTRRVLQVPGATTYRIRIQPPSGDAYERVVPASADDAPIALTQVPLGPNQLLTLEVLLDGEPSGIDTAAFVALSTGVNTLSLGPWEAATGQVAKRILDLDRAQSTQVLATLTPAALTEAVKRYLASAKMSYPELLNFQLAAEAIHTAGALPDAIAGVVNKPGRLVLTRSTWPEELYSKVVVDDGLSDAGLTTGRDTLVIDPVLPGTWTVSTLALGKNEEDVPEIAPLTVTIGAGQTVTLELPYETLPAVAPALPFGLAGAIFGEVDGQYYAWGGYQPQAEWHTGLLSYDGAEWQVAEADLPPSFEGAAAGATLDGVMYAIGGEQAAPGADTAWAFDPLGSDGPQAIAPLPEGRTVLNGTAGAVGGYIVVCGGLWKQGDATTIDSGYYLYDPEADSWDYLDNVNDESSDSEESVSLGMFNMSTAVVDDRMYLFGGEVFQQVSTQNAVLDLFAEDGATWQVLTRMPTARAGVTTAVVDGRIWVIGGYTFGSEPSAAVEVYDPETDTWEIRQPLRTPRAYAIAAVVDGEIIVSGGTQGSSSTTHRLTDAVEVITP